MRTIYRLPDRLTFLGISGIPKNGNPNYLDGYVFQGPRPTESQILAVREQIGLVDYLSEIIMFLVPNPNADFIEDDYYATIWRDARPLPLLAQVLAAKDSYKNQKERNYLINAKATDISRSARTRISALDPLASTTVVDVLSRLSVPITPINSRLVAIHQYAKQVSSGLATKTNQEITDYDPSRDTGFPT